MKFNRLIFIGLIIGLQACGFHLRGFATLPEHVSRLQLVTDSLTTDQQQYLTQQLKRAGATMHYSDGANIVQLRISIKSLPERSLVDSAGSGQAIVRLSRQLNYSLIDSSGERLVDDKTLVWTLDLELDENNLLGAEGEKQSALQDIDDVLFNNLMIQLRRL